MSVSRRALLAAAIASPVLAVSVPASAGEAASAGLAAATNRSRERHGLRPYRRRARLDRVARRWSEHLAEAGALGHNPRLTAQVGEWSEVGENVHVGQDWREIHRGLMASPPHRANVLSRRFRHFGVGTTRDRDGALWACVVFVRP